MNWKALSLLIAGLTLTTGDEKMTKLSNKRSRVVWRYINPLNSIG